MSSDIVTTLKYIAKRLSRAGGQQHAAALDFVAEKLGQPHWRALMEAHKRGWQPDPAQVTGLEGTAIHATLAMRIDYTALALETLGQDLTFNRWVPQDVQPMEADEIHGELDGHPFYLVGDEFSVAIGSQGWEISLDQSPRAKPMLKRLGSRVKSVAALDPAYVKRATQLVQIRARRMHADVAADWPLSSTMPDHDGRAQHPLGGGMAAEWHCLHCDGVHSGRTMAMSLWHCPDCGATPIDIFAEPFEDEAKLSA